MELPPPEYLYRPLSAKIDTQRVSNKINVQKIVLISTLAERVANDSKLLKQLTNRKQRVSPADSKAVFGSCLNLGNMI